MSMYHCTVVLSVLGNVAEKLPVLLVVPNVMLYTDHATREVEHEGTEARSALGLETWGPGAAKYHSRTRR